jgi:glycosyltransferase involved in cell wall biosynthesis
MTGALHLRSSATLAGPERHLLELAPALARRGVACRCLLLVRAAAGEAPGHPLTRAPGAGSLETEVLAERGRRLDPAVAARIGSSPEAILHSHDPRANAHVLAAGRGRRIATVHLHTRSTLALRIHRWVDLWQLRRFDAVILVARALDRGALARAVPRRRRHVVPNGLDVPRWRARAAAEADSARAALAAAGGAGSPQLVVAGRLTRQKGIDLALAALARLAPRFPAARLAVAGEGPESAALARRARELGVAGRVAWLGYRADVAGLLSLADLVLLPSRREGLPYAALEAMALARPLLAAAVGGVGEVVRDGVDGRLVSPGDPEALAAAALELLAAPEAASTLGERGRERVARDFDADAMASRTAEIYAAA